MPGTLHVRDLGAEPLLARRLLLFPLLPFLFLLFLLRRLRLRLLLLRRRRWFLRCRRRCALRRMLDRWRRLRMLNRLIPVRLSRSRTVCFRPIARFCWLRTIIWLIHCWTIVRLCRRRRVRRWGWTIRLRRIRRSGPLVRSRLIARPIQRLICRRCGLPRTRCVWRVTGSAHARRGRFPWRRLLHHWPRCCGIGRAQGLHLALG